ncbi:hypothetical protein MVEG_07857 [Podila verticillata NRRL 6337]|nr:hypothetical protein MVEG_07857 [Podila verticillata NRRL 6337]
MASSTLTRKRRNEEMTNTSHPHSNKKQKPTIQQPKKKKINRTKQRNPTLSSAAHASFTPSLVNDHSRMTPPFELEDAELADSVLGNLETPHQQLHQKANPELEVDMQALENCIGIWLRRNTEVGVLSLDEVVEEFTGAVRAAAPSRRQQPHIQRTHNHNNSDSSSTTSSNSSPTRHSLGTTTESKPQYELELVHPQSTVLATNLVREVRKLVMYRNDGIRLLVLHEMIQGYLDHLPSLQSTRKPNRRPPPLSPSRQLSPTPQQKLSSLHLRRSARLLARTSISEKK